MGSVLLASLLMAGCAGPDVRQRRLADERGLERSTGTIFGTVVDSATRTPLRGVYLEVEGTRRAAYTDEHGRFAVRGVRPGTARVWLDGRAIPGGYGGRFDTASVAVGVQLERNFALGQRPLTWADSESVGVEVRGAERQMRCEIRLTKQRYRVGEYPQYVARVYYTGPDSINLAEAIRGSMYTKNPPSAQVRIHGPDCGARYGVDFNVDGSPPHLDEGDFFVLHDGEYMFAAVTPAGDSVVTSRVKFDCPGTYRVEFEYSTQAPLARGWIRSGPDANRPSPLLLAILRRLPCVDLRCETSVRVDP